MPDTRTSNPAPPSPDSLVARLTAARTWERPEVLAVNRRAARSHFRAFPTARDALAASGSDGSTGPGEHPEPQSRAAATPAERNPWRQSLNGRWQFELLERPEALEARHIAPGGPPLAHEITVPGNWTMQGFDRPHYTNVVMPFPHKPPRVPDENPTGVYRTSFSLRESFAGRRTLLYIGGAESVYHVFLNGREIGYATDTRLPSEFDISEALSGGENTLAIVVIRWSAASFIEDQDQWWMAGIHRDVELISVGDVFIDDVDVSSLPLLDVPDSTAGGNNELGEPAASLDASATTSEAAKRSSDGDHRERGFGESAAGGVGSPARRSYYDTTHPGRIVLNVKLCGSVTAANAAGDLPVDLRITAAVFERS
ncbi:MAG: sugar-binding domain-containing protein, partial [Spirochaetales bacterium]